MVHSDDKQHRDPEAGNLFHLNCNNKFLPSISRFIKANFKLPKQQQDNIPDINDSFGFLHDKDNNLSPFVRIDGRRNDSDFMENIFDLLHFCWKIPRPKSVLEVTGGAEQIVSEEFENKLSDFLLRNCQYLVDQGAWVIASGTDCGIMKIIGDTFLEAKKRGWKTPQCIGIATWPTLDGEDLSRMGIAKGSCVAYSSSKPGQQRKEKLNMGYDCFILVDKGQKGFGQEIDFRNQFIDYISIGDPHAEANEENNLPNLPVTLLVVSGGIGTLKTVDLAVTLHGDDEPISDEVNARPRHVVVVEKSGRAVQALEDFIFGPHCVPGLTVQEFNRIIESNNTLLHSMGKTEDERKRIKTHLLNILIRKHMIRTISIEPPTSGSFFSDWNDFELLEKFTENNFEFRQCCEFNPVTKEDYKEFRNRRQDLYDSGRLCWCGLERELHARKAASRECNEQQLEVVPQPSTCPVGILRFVKDPQASSANLLSFIPTYSRYVRMYYDDHADDDLFWQKLNVLFKEFWGMRRAQVLIEVTGTAEDLRYVKPNILRNLKIGLVEAAHKAKAWVITGGTNAGVMKVVGDAMNEYRATHGGSSVPCIGIATWGMIDQRYKIFDRKAVIDGVADYLYKNDEDYETRKQNGSYIELNSGHDHFLLIDTGKEERFGQEISFKTKFLEYLGKQAPYKSTIKGSKTPSVLLVIGGGIGTLKTVKAGLDVRRTMVFLKGFGGCSDFFSLIYTLAESVDTEEEENLLEEIMDDPFFDKLFSQLSEGKTMGDSFYSEDNVMKELLNKKDKKYFIKILKDYFIENEELISVLDMMTAQFDPNSDADSFPLEDIILDGIFKRAKGRDKSIQSSFDLSLKWNRADFARKLISDRESITAVQNASEKSAIPFAKPLTSAIKRNQAELFELLIESGLADPYLYLSANSQKQLSVLFHKLLLHPSSREGLISKGHAYLFRKLSEHQKRSHTPFRLNYEATDIAESRLYQMEKDLMKIFDIRRSFGFAPNASINIPPPIQFIATSDSKLDNVSYNIIIKNLMMLQLFLCRDGFAVAIWKSASTSDFIGAAVMASVFCGDLAQVARDLKRQDLSELYEENEIKWEKRAVAVIMELSEGKLSFLREMLTRGLKTWQDKTVLELAYAGRRKSVIAAPPVQVVLHNIWGSIWHSNSVQSARAPKKKWSSFADFSEVTCFPSNKVENYPESNNSTFRRLKSIPKSIVNSRYPYHVPPKIKFSLYTISLSAFLLLFFGDLVHTAHEFDRCSSDSQALICVVWVWALAFAADAIYELAVIKYATFDNIITLIAECLLVSSSVLYWAACDTQSGEYRWKMTNAAKTMYALSCLVFWFKCFRVFLVDRTLGPKVWAFIAMFRDILFFSILHLIILFAFAGPIYALSMSRPGHESKWPFREYVALMFKVLYNQWWNIVDVEVEETKERALGTCTAAMSLDVVNQTRMYFEDYTDPDEKCNYTNILASLLQMVFMLLSNIMLLNMLIAYLTLTVEEMHSSAETKWKFEQYQRIRCFVEKTIFPPPFNLIEIFFLVFNKIGETKEGSNNPFLTHFKEGETRQTKYSMDLSERNRKELENAHYTELDRLEKLAISQIPPELLKE